MQNPLVILLIVIISAVTGFLIGKFISKLKSEKDQAGFEEKNNLLIQQLNDFKQNIEKEKESYENSLGKLQETNEILKLDAKEGIEHLRKQKDSELDEARKTENELRIELTKLQSELKNNKEKLQENKGEVEKLQEKFAKEFENLANKILDEKSTKFKEQNKESISEIFKPAKRKNPKL